MKILCKREILAEKVNIVSKAVSNRTTLPILECILLTASDRNGFKLLANDLEIGIETKPIEADILEPGDVALNARVFFDIVRRLPGEDVYLETYPNHITLIKSGISEFKILGHPGEEFPLLPVFEQNEGESFEIPAGTFKNMIRQTLFSVSTDESKAAMMGEMFTVEGGLLKIASVDGFRISVRLAEIDNKEMSACVIVPGKTLSEIMKILQSSEKTITTVRFAEKHILFETEDAIIVSRLIEGKFLDYETVFVTECTSYMIVDNQAMLNCMERASLISREAKKSPVKLTIDKERDMLVVESNTDMGTFFEEIPVEIDGLNLEIAFNPRYIADVLKVTDEERVKFQFTTPLSPCSIKSVDHELYRYLILPLRVKG